MSPNERVAPQGGSSETSMMDQPAIVRQRRSRVAGGSFCFLFRVSRIAHKQGKNVGPVDTNWASFSTVMLSSTGSLRVPVEAEWRCRCDCCDRAAAGCTEWQPWWGQPVCQGEFLWFCTLTINLILIRASWNQQMAPLVILIMFSLTLFC